MKTRRLLPDVMRGFAAVLVVLGHCIQECGGLEMRVCQYYWYSKPYQFIYSFHMPFFMLLTGYFAAAGFAKTQNRFTYLRRRVLACLLPVFAMTALDFLRLYIEARIKGVGLPYENIGDYFKTAYYSLWFLWAVAIFYVMVFFVNSVLGRLSFVWELLVYVLIFFALFVITDDYNFHVYKFVYPFFVMGYTYFKYEDRIKAVYEKRKEAWLFVMTVALTALFSLYNERIFIYVSGYRITNASWYKMVACDMYRIAIGMAGSLFFMMLIDQLAGPVINKMEQKGGKGKTTFTEKTVKVFAALGRESLGIYVIQGYIILMFLGKFTDPYYYKAYVIIPCAIITLSISFIVLKLFGLVKSKLISIAHLAKHE